jgi:hypothetical protein
LKLRVRATKIEVESDEFYLGETNRNPSSYVSAAKRKNWIVLGIGEF